MPTTIEAPHPHVRLRRQKNIPTRQENKEEDLETKKKHLEKMLEKEFEEQDKKI